MDSLLFTWFFVWCNLDNNTFSNPFMMYRLNFYASKYIDIDILVYYTSYNLVRVCGSEPDNALLAE